MKPFTVIGLLLAAALLAAALYTSRSGSATQTAARTRPDLRAQDGARTFHPPPRSNDPSSDGAPTTRPGVRRAPRTAIVARAAKPKTVGELPQAEPKTTEETPEELEPVIPIEVARAALAMVGHDPDAEDAWVEAINDPALSPKDRSDLIEDLNEDGFPDPKNITMDDLPLILNRIALIEDVGPGAMDDVNAAAFAEAYKDLNNMLAKLAAELEEDDDGQAGDNPGNVAPEVFMLRERYARRASARR
jgi:hypothetical protein